MVENGTGQDTPVAIFRHQGFSLDYTPDEPLVAGQIVVLEDMVGIAHAPLPGGRVSSLMVEGVFLAPKKTGAAWDMGEWLFYDITEGAFGVSGDFIAGLAAADAHEDDEQGFVKLHPTTEVGGLG